MAYSTSQPDPHSSGGGSNSAALTSVMSTQGLATVSIGQETQAAPSAEVTRPAPQAGQQIGPVRLLRELGRGAMGVVFLGQHTLLDRSVAVKFISVSSGGSRGDYTRFFEEAKAAAAVRHPHLTQIYHADVANDVPYLVLEYVDGPTLSQLLHHAGRLPLRWALSIVGEIADAVGELHDQGIVHRDLKPSNVMLDHGGRVLVTDFGLAIRRDPGGGGATDRAPAGTPAYMAPEMFDGRVSPRSDIYALGFVLFQMVTGKVPFEGTFDEMRRKHEGEALPMERLREAGVPEDVIEIIERATHKQLMFRYKTAHELGRAIVGLGGDVAEIAKARSELRAMILSLGKAESAAAGSGPGSSGQGSGQGSGQASDQGSGQGSSTRRMPEQAPSSTATYADTIARVAQAKRERLKTLMESDSAASAAKGQPPAVMFDAAGTDPAATPGLWSAYQTPAPAPEASLAQPVAAITTACLIAIVLGGAGVLWAVIQGVLGPSQPRSVALPVAMRIWQVVLLLVSLGLSVALIAGGVAGLALKNWGRKLVVIAGGAGIVVQALSLPLSMAWIAPAIEQAGGFSKSGGPFVSAGGLLQVNSGLLLALKAVMICTALGIALFLLMRARVKAAFKGIMPSQA